MNKKKSKALAFLLATSLIVPTVEGTVLAATSEEIRDDIEITQDEVIKDETTQDEITQDESASVEDAGDVEAPSQSSIFESGDGSQKNPYIINSVEQFKAFRDSVNKGSTYQNQYIQLNANIDLKGETWEPIGKGTLPSPLQTKIIPFLGNFDGGNKVISNLNIRKPLGAGVGLFGYANNGIIKNIVIDNANVTGSYATGALIGQVGALQNISNVTISGDIEVKGAQHTGGMFGYGYIGKIENCKVIGNGGSYIESGKSVGGLIGYLGEGNNEIKDSTVINLDIKGAERVGGIVGTIQRGNKVLDCKVENTNIRKNSFTSNQAKTFGTIAGSNQATSTENIRILNCETKDTYAYIEYGKDPLTQKISMFNAANQEIKEGVVVGSGVVEKDGKVVDGEFEILTSDMYNSTSKLCDIENGKYILVPTDTVAIVGKTPFASIDKAIEGSKKGDTIRMVEGLEIDSPIDLNLNGKNARTIDFNGKEIKPSKSFKEDTLLNISNASGVRLANGNFVVNNDNVANAVNIKDSSDIVLNNIKVDKTSAKEGAAIVVEKSNVNIEGKLDVNGEKAKTTAAIEVNGSESKVTVKKGSDIETEDKIPDIVFTNGANKEDSFTDENEEKPVIPSIPSTPSVPSKPSKPTYTHEEIIGSDRYDTAAKIADQLGSYDNVVLVNATSTMSDGLSASGLAGKENGAILLTKKDSIPKATMDRIKKVKKVYIIGGEAAISQKVSDEITKNVPNVKIERLGGKTRVETSELVAKKLGNYSDAFVVNGFKGEADAMSASAIAAKKGAPILLTNGKTSTHAKKSGVEYYVIGGNSVVDKSIADKYNAEVLAGKDRYATNKEVINEFYSGSDKVYIANGDKLVDALTASPLAKKDGIVLVNEKSDKSILKGKNTVQVGGMDFKIEFER